MVGDGRRWRALIECVAIWPAYVSAALLVVLTLFTAVDVALRYLFNAPVYGGLEVSESAMVALIMLAMAYCGATDGHVRVDVFDSALGRTGRRLSDIFTGVISLIVLWFLCERTWRKALEAYEYGDVTNFLEIPLWPLYGLIVIGMGAYAVVILIKTTGRATELLLVRN